VAYSEEYFLRFVLQAIMVVIWFNFQADAETMIKALLSTMKVPGKNKFKHFLHDLGLRNAIALTIFTLSLVASVLIPLIVLPVALLFWIAYALDKYNLLFVYPLDFESNMVNRKTLVSQTFASIILF